MLFGTASSTLDNIFHANLFYGLISVLIGSIIAWIMGNKITRRLYTIQNTLSEVKAGNNSARTHLDGNDEAAQLAGNINAMLDIIEAREQELKQINCHLEVLVDERTEELNKVLTKALQSENDLKVAQHVAHIGSWSIDIKTKSLLWSDETYDIFAIQRGTPLTLNQFVACIHPDDRDSVVTAWSDALTGTPFTIEHRIVAGDNIKWVYESAQLTFDDQGTPLSAVGIVQDITARKEAEEALAESQSIYRNLFESSMDGIFILDMQGNFLDANNTAYERLGYSRDEFLDLHITELDHPEFAVSVPERLQQIMEFGSATFESGHLAKSGTLMPVEISSRIINFKGQQAFFSHVRDITERKTAELRLQENQIRLELAMRAVNMGVWSWDIQQNLRTFDEQTCALLGLDRSMFKGSAEEFLAVIHTDDREVVKRALTNTLENDSNYEVEYRVIWPDNSLHYVSARGKLIRSESGVSLRIKGVLWDDTARKQSGQLLKENEERYRAIFSGSPDAYLIMELPDGRISDCNAAAEKMLRGSREMIIGNTPDRVSPLYQPNGRLSSDEAAERIRESLESGSNRFEWMHRRLDGLEFWADVSLSVLQMSGRQVLMVAWRDISDKKLVEATIKESKQQLQNIIDFLPDATFVVDQNKVVIAWNKAMEEMSGVRADDILGQGDYAYTIPFYGERRPQLIDLLDSNDEEITRKYLHIHRNGNSLNAETFVPKIYSGKGAHVWAIAAPLFNSNGERIGYVEAIRDISERKYIEIELQRSMEAADCANRAKSEFLSNMSHEIRTPLNGIIGMTQIMGFTRLDEEQREYLEIIKASSNNLLGLVNDVLDLSKIEAGKIELEKSEFSLRATISDVVNTQSSLVHGKGLQLITDITDDIPDYLIGDQLRLKQIIHNFLSNAIKFTDSGRISLTVARPADAINAIRICVTDTGIGISHEAIQRIFEPFSQADSSTTRKFGGTGLGLTICRQLAELMGGKIEVESTAGVGSAFSVIIPFVASSMAAKHQVSQDSKTSLLKWDGRPLRILIVDDNEINLKVAGYLLKNAGIDFVPASDGQEALDAWQAFSFDLILMDVHMPVMNGIEATKVIRGKEAGTGKRTPIIALTADALDEEQKNILKQGFDGYVSKPFEIKTLFAEIRRCVPD